MKKIFFRVFCCHFFQFLFSQCPPKCLAARAKMSLSRAQNIFMPANINSIVILGVGKNMWKHIFYLMQQHQTPRKGYSTTPGADEQELATPIRSLCHGIFTDWSIFSTPFLLWKRGSSGPVTQWRQLVSCDGLWHSHGSLIQSRFDLKINRSMKTPWQKYSWVACSCS